METAIADPHVAPQVGGRICCVQREIGLGVLVGIMFAWLNNWNTAGEFETGSLRVEGSGVTG